MANMMYYFKGMINWAKVQKPDDKYNVYTLDLYLDEPSLEMFKDSGLQLTLRDGDDGKYIKLRRPVEKVFSDEVIDNGKPEVLVKNSDGEWESFGGLVGNGSTGVCKVRVYDSKRGKGHELVTVAIEELVPYEEAVTVGDDEYPF